MRVLLNRKGSRVAIAVAILSLLVSGTALALSPVRPESHTPNHVNFSGNGLVGTRIATDASQQIFVGTDWKSLTGSSVYVSVPSGSQRLVSVTFSAESNCSGSAAVDGCLVRVVGRKSGTSELVEFYPRTTGIGYFDTVPTQSDFWEHHAMTRTKTLTAGTWQVFVQARMTAADGVSLGLAAWSNRADVFAK